MGWKELEEVDSRGGFMGMKGVKRKEGEGKYDRREGGMRRGYRAEVDGEGGGREGGGDCKNAISHSFVTHSYKIGFTQII